jgi:Ca2+-binding RTX toxin-like protein
MDFFDLTDGPDNRTFLPGEVAGLGVRGLGGDDTINGSGDAEDINANLGNDFIDGRGGNDTLRGGQQNDFLTGNDGNDLVNGNLGDDNVSGNAGDDVVRGGQGNDGLNGDNGNDFLYGDLGQDFLTGGAGDDVFVLRTDTAVANASLTDQIFDFGVGSDLIGLTGGLTETGISLVSGGGNLPFTAADTLIRIGTTGDFLGVVFNFTPGQLAGRFTSAPD